MRNIKKEPPGKTGRLSKCNNQTKILLVDHPLHNVADDGQLELFMRVRLDT